MPTQDEYSIRRLPPFVGFMRDLSREVRQYWNLPGYIDIDMEAVEAVRHEASARGQRLTYTAFVVKAIAEAVVTCAKATPELNAALIRTPLQRIVYFRSVDVGLAVEAEHEGKSLFFTPVLRSPDHRSLPEIASEIATAQRSDPADRTGLGKDLWVVRLPSVLRRIVLALGANRAKLLKQYRGTVFLSNVGHLGMGMYVTGNRNLEFAMGPVELVPWVMDGEVKPRRRMRLTVVFDHRTLHAAPVARLLMEIRRLLEGPPARWLANAETERSSG